MTMSPDGGEPIDLLRSLAQLSSDAIIVADSGMRIVAFNESALGIFGFSAEELRGRSVLDLVPPASRHGMEARLGARLDGTSAALGRSWHSRFTRGDGTVRDIEHVVNTWESGGKRYFGAIIRDITEWEQAKEALSLSEAKYRGLVDNAAAGIAIVGLDGRVSFANNALCALSGYSLQDMLGRPFWDFIHPDDAPRLPELFKNTPVGAAAPSVLEFRLVRKDGSIAHCYCSPTVTRRGDEVVSFNAVILDITELRLAQDALRESEEIFRNLAEQSPNMIFINMNGKVVYANRLCGELTGYTREEFLSPTFDFLQITAPEYRAMIAEKFALHTNGLEIPPYEYAVMTKDGRRLDTILSTKLINYCGVRAILGTITDITERRKSEEALRASEEKYRELVENVSDVIYSVGLDGTITYVSPSIERIIGYSPAELLGKRFHELVYKDDMPKTVAEFRRRVDGVVEPAEYRLVARGGGLRSISTTSRQLRSGGRIIGLTGVLTDVTDRKKAESAIRDSEEKYRMLFESSPEGVVLLDLDGKILDINRAALSLQELSREKVVGRSFTDLSWIHEEDLARYIERFRRRVEGEVAPPVEIRVRTPKGDRWQEVFPALLEKDGDIRAIQVILRDVTERRIAQREMLSRLMSYELEEGNLYLVKEAAPVLSLEGFHDLLKAGYRGAVISRTPAQRFRREPSQQFEFRWISEKDSAHTLPPDVAAVERWLDSLPRNTAVLIDRLDYIMLRNGFEKTLRFVHQARDLAYLMGHVIILSLDPASVGVKELRALDREALEIVPRARPKLPDDLYDVLRSVYQQGAIGRRPTLTELREGMDLSKPTMTKRVMNLVAGGYLALSTRGRTKQVELTEKGRRVFLK